MKFHDLFIRFSLAFAVTLAVSPSNAFANSAVGHPRVRFSQIPTRIGDRVQQQVAVEINLKTVISQSGQTAHESEDKMVRRQKRAIEVTQVDGEKFKAARVSFPLSRMVVPGETSPSLDDPQPVEGKSYLFSRVGEKTTITDLKGEMPPLEEYKIVADSLKTLGKPNLLAKHLLEKQPQVGQRLLVPRKVAKSLFGMNDDMGGIKRFELTLREVQPSAKNQSPLAIFDAKIETMPNETSPMQMVVAGQVAIEIETCRILSAELSGPIGMSTTQPTEGGILHYGISGQLRMATQADYR
ncbi:MAG: hypothetical protein RH917_08395 [Lacipirellulaceae bacterium]